MSAYLNPPASPTGTDERYDLDEGLGELVHCIVDVKNAVVREQLHGQMLTWIDRCRDPFRGPERGLRLCNPNSRSEGMGVFRPRPADGYAPVVRDYDTGMPTRGIKREAKTTPKSAGGGN